MFFKDLVIFFLCNFDDFFRSCYSYGSSFYRCPETLPLDSVKVISVASHDKLMEEQHLLQCCKDSCLPFLLKESLLIRISMQFEDELILYQGRVSVILVMFSIVLCCN